MQKETYILLVFLVAAGCGSVRSEDSFTAEKNQKNLAKLKHGMSKEHVLMIMGTETAGSIKSKENAFEILFYNTQAKVSENTIKRVRPESTPFVFDDGTFVGLGWEFLRSYLEENKNQFLKEHSQNNDDKQEQLDHFNTTPGR